MDWTVIRRITVLRNFSAGPEPGSVAVSRDCRIGCECAAVIYKVSRPNAMLAEDKSLCFNDRKKQGISEIGGSAVRVMAPDGVDAFEVQANVMGVRGSDGTH